jgi:LysM repeat protein
MVLALALALIISGCGRSAPEEAVDDPEPTTGTTTHPDIAGVSITSPDAVIDPEEGPVVTGTTAPDASGEPQGTYTIEPGDTLSVIASRYDVSVDELAEANGISDVNDLTPGQELIIPPVVPIEVTVVDASEQILRDDETGD